MFRSNTFGSLALVLALATPALAQQTEHDQQQPSAAVGPATRAPQQGGVGGIVPETSGTPTTVINNTFNPTGPTGTGTFNPTGEFVVRINEDCGVRREPLVGTIGMMSASASHVEGRIAFLKTELKITAAQLPLWNAVADAIRDNAKSMATISGEIMLSQSATLPERLAAREKVMAARLDAVHKLKAALGPLYAALTDEQKKVEKLTTAD